MVTEVLVVGGGLAGCECAFQLAERGVDVCIVEQKPGKRTPAQIGDGLAELVCSNSFRGAALTNAVGLLKEEMRRAGSLVMAVGDEVRVPAGGAFAVDRELFSKAMTARIAAHPRIRVEAREVTEIPTERPVVIATGPLTGDALAASIAALVGTDHLAYYDAIAPIVSAASLDESKVFRASRYDKGNDDAYVNCPLDKVQYTAFVEALRAAEKVAPREFEKVKYFEGCLPVEVMAERGERTLAFGPMKPVGLTDPRTGRWPYAVVQLRPEDEDRTAFNMVGFQTRMKWPEQKRVFSMIPGLENVEILRYGSVHRNTFVEAPRVLEDDLSIRGAPGVHLAGQVAGVEGYVESAACGLLLGIALGRSIAEGASFADSLPPRPSALGSLWSHLRTPSDRYQPSNVMFSMFPSLEVQVKAKNKGLHKRARYAVLAERALEALEPWLTAVGATKLATARVGQARVEDEAPEAGPTPPPAM
ncbi:MAG: methylenetetrahydrofolate--tRNA-(uracil(54)-C(5))-methyltransferase (FADH(2)-oxidizing) TrmFO [Deltaproteobacteria bacterium]|nr:methylenetetrahydrofolate--tRNA-(uracil(54)-C(5))-methyltransferase (FADH(2)-oxidizing) TrmFO [Deltaproteobacteria bacterium]